MRIRANEACIRMLVIFGMVFATYNPSGYSYVHWLVQSDVGPLSLKIAIGIFLLLAYYVVLTVTYAVFRPAGLIAGGATILIFSVQTLTMGLPESGLNSFNDYALFTTYVLLMSLAILIGFGLSWSKFVTWLTGQEQKRYTDPGG